MSEYKNTLLTAIALSFVPSFAAADPIRLYSPDGQVEMFGELLEVKEDTFIIQTGVGPMSIDREMVICEGAACPKTDLENADIVVRGSDTVGEVLFPLLVEGYANLDRAAVSERKEVGPDTVHLVVREDRGQGEQKMVVEVQAAGSSTGFAALLDGTADIGMSSRPPKSQEYRDFQNQGLGDLEDIDHEYIVAVDSILMVVSPDNPISELSVDQAARLFSGRIRNWSELGGNDVPVSVYTRPETSGTRAVFENAILTGGRKISDNATVASSNEALAELVTNDPGGIGYVGFAAVRDAKPIDITLSCGIATKATPFAAKTEEYLLQRRLRLYVDGADHSDTIQGLLDFAISHDADGLIQQAGFIDLGVIADSGGLDTEALLNSTLTSNETVRMDTLRNMIQTLDGAARLSTTFRFASGSARLDNKAQRDIARMIEFLALPQNAGKEVMVVGFTDADGDFSANERLSRSRAQVVIDAIRNHPESARISELNFQTHGFGELAPVGCNDDFQGRYRNRRVEVWLR